jgi:molybdate transport system ATP-binding protein
MAGWPQAACRNGRMRAMVELHAELKLAHGPFQLDVALRLPGSGVSVLLGPSGCGKTTVLRAIAGLERAQGRVALNGDVWQDDGIRPRRFVPTHQRPIGYVFQEASLFPHLSVQANLDYGRQRVPKAQQRVSQADAVDLLGIAHLLGRMPDRLSGGERQRVAIARALLTSPSLLLMDEPLSALDPARKAEVLPYLEALGKGGVPIVYVTHALDEAARLADHLVLLQAGRVQAEGAASALLSRLDTPLSQLDDAAALLHARVQAHELEQGLSRLNLAHAGAPDLPMWVGRAQVDVGNSVRVRVLARDVSVSLGRAADSSILNILPTVIDSLQDDASGSVMLRLRLPSQDHLLARVTRRSVEVLQLQPGMAVFAQIKGAALLRG